MTPDEEAQHITDQIEQQRHADLAREKRGLEPHNRSSPPNQSQAEHAAGIRQKTEDRRHPEEAQVRQFASLINQAVRDAVPSVLKDVSQAEKNSLLGIIQTPKPPDVKPPPHPAPQPKDNLPSLPFLPDITVYDLDGSTVLHTGHGTEFYPIAVDNAAPPTMKDAAWYKTEFCEGGETKTAYILRTALE